MLEKKGLEKEVEFFFFAPRGVLYYMKNKRRRIEKNEDYLVNI
jgi:hypothetical protein